MLVRDIMTRHVVTVDMDASMEQVRDVFAAADFRHLIVVEQGAVVGVLSDRDQMRHLSPFVGKMAERSQDIATLKRRVHQFMTRSPVTAAPDDQALGAARRMLRERISCLPVVDPKGRLDGIVTLSDLAKLAVTLLERETQADNTQADNTQADNTQADNTHADQVEPNDAGDNTGQTKGETSSAEAA